MAVVGPLVIEVMTMNKAELVAMVASNILGHANVHDPFRKKLVNLAVTQALAVVMAAEEAVADPEEDGEGEPVEGEATAMAGT